MKEEKSRVLIVEDKIFPDESLRKNLEKEYIVLRAFNTTTPFIMV